MCVMEKITSNYTLIGVLNNRNIKHKNIRFRIKVIKKMSENLRKQTENGKEETTNFSSR